jgi:hypothetical protein
MPTERTILPTTQVYAIGARIPFRKAGHILTISTVGKIIDFTSIQMSDSAEEETANVKYHELI